MSMNFNNGGQIPSYGNEKPAAQLIDELSKRNRRYRQMLNKLANLDEKDPKYKLCVWINCGRKKSIK